MEHWLECKNCGRLYSGNFCPQCGQSAHEKRIDARWLLHDVPHSVFHIDKGFFYTLKSLFTHPARMVKEYLEGKRVKYFRPFAYVVLMTTVSSLVVESLQTVTESVLLKKAPAVLVTHNESFFAHYFSLLIFMMIPLAALITWLSFYTRKYNYWEHFLINTYLSAQLNLFLIIINLVTLIVALFSNKLTDNGIGLIISFFMVGFLFLYGSTFGGLMSRGRRGIVALSFIITMMNLLLFFLYYIGLIVSGIIH
ncbi:MAG: DUF3667 domain-containing protein [Niabella sp.]